MQQACLFQHSQEETHKCFCLTAQHYNFLYFQDAQRVFFFFLRRMAIMSRRLVFLNPGRWGKVSCMASVMPCLNTPDPAHRPALQKPDNGGH